MVESLTQEDWNGVYYDGMNGEFLMFEIQDENVILTDPFVGDKVDVISLEEFEDYVFEDYFQEVSQNVVRNPTEVVENLLMEATNAISGDSSGFMNYHPTEVDFAITATNLSMDDDAPYLETVE